MVLAYQVKAIVALTRLKLVSSSVELAYPIKAVLAPAYQVKATVTLT